MADRAPEARRAELVLNRALIDKETNRRIGAKAPSLYLSEFVEEREPGAVDQIFESHLLPDATGDCFSSDEYAGFLRERAQLVAEEITTVTGLAVPWLPAADDDA